MPLLNECPQDTMDNVGSPLDYVEIKIVDRKTGNLVQLNQEGMCKNTTNNKIQKNEEFLFLTF